MAKIVTEFTQNIIFPSGETLSTKFTTSIDRNFKIGRYFKLYELANNLAKENIKMIWNSDIDEHVRMLDELRVAIGPITVTSGYRTPSFNKSVGGSPNSLHLKCVATDIRSRKMTENQWNFYLSIWQAICKKHNKIGGINRYTNGIHVASREDLLGAKSFVIRDYRGTKDDW